MKTKNIILIHFLYWFYIVNQLLFPMYVSKFEEANMLWNEYIKDIAISLFLNIISFYIIYFAFPKIISLKKKILIFPSAAIIVILILGIRLLIDWCFWKYIGYEPGKEMAFQWIWIWNGLRMIIITGIYAILIRFMINMFETRKFRDELIKQRQAGELALLKSQVNPHFLFNTLNNIYSLVYNKSDKASEAVMKFSLIMRYVLYDATAKNVLLEKEIEYLNSYIELQKLRLNKSALVTLSIDGNIDGIKIAPMLLIPFVENAFKHGNINHQHGISISLHTLNNTIRFEVSNYIKEDNHTTEKQYSGIGLSNIYRRLELIYPGKYKLDIKKDNDQFKVNLLIKQ